MMYSLYLNVSFLRTWIMSCTVFKPSKCIWCQVSCGMKTAPSLLQSSLHSAKSLNAQHCTWPSKQALGVGWAITCIFQRRKPRLGEGRSLLAEVPRAAKDGPRSRWRPVCYPHLTPLGFEAQAGFQIRQLHCPGWGHTERQGERFGAALSPRLVFSQQTVERFLAFSVFCHMWGFPRFSLLLRGEKKMKSSSETLQFVE